MTTPLDPAPHLQYPPQGWEANCRLTNWFIGLDPYPVQLIPVTKVKQPGGGEKTQKLPPRPEQVVRVIYVSGDSDGLTLTVDGQIRKYSTVMVGGWSSTIKVGDEWTDKNGATWRVDGLQPYNGYEVKAGCTLVGANPSMVQ